MRAEPLRPNRFHRYALLETAYLADVDGARYVLIGPAVDGYRVERGVLGPGHGDEPPARTPAAEPERFPPDGLASAVQRVCALAAEWLGYDEREVEQTRRLFIAGEAREDGG
jgi:hypothetical protein